MSNCLQLQTWPEIPAREQREKLRMIIIYKKMVTFWNDQSDQSDQTDQTYYYQSRTLNCIFPRSNTWGALRFQIIFHRTPYPPETHILLVR